MTGDGMYNVIDLFAGAGGLSLGFMQTGKFQIKVAFENNPAMQETYRKNHKEVDVRGDVCVADYQQIVEQYGDIDVVIGGPPCQGFSNANRQKSHAISQNNMLVKEYIRAIQELQPKAFVMENVSMLKSDVHRFYLSHDDVELVSGYKIKTKETPLLLLEKECVFEGVETIIEDPISISKYLWPEEDYTVLNIIYKASKNKQKLRKALEKHKRKLIALTEKYEAEDSRDHIINKGALAFRTLLNYFHGQIEAEDIASGIKDAVCIQRMLKRGKEITDNNLIVDRYEIKDGLCAVIRSYAVYDYLKAVLGASNNGYVINDKVLCAADYGAPQKRMRFVVVGVKRNISDKIALPNGYYDEDQYLTVNDAIKDLEDISPVYDLDEDKDGIILPKADHLSDLAKQLRDSKILKNHIITRTTEVALERFSVLKEGQNFHSLSTEMKENTYTDVKRTQNTIYLRLKYSDPSGTVVNVRKSMWIHPTLDRAISIREAARLQTFPDSFVFYGTKDKQYQQVGNAVPPFLAKAIAEKIAAVLAKQKIKDKENVG